MYSTLASPVQDVDALVQSSDAETHDAALKLQAAIERLDKLYSSRSANSEHMQRTPHSCHKYNEEAAALGGQATIATPN